MSRASLTNSALTTIGTVCVKHLNECFAEDDVRQMRKSHLKEIKTFLLRISQEKVTNVAFGDCKVMEYVENEVDKDKDQIEISLASDTNENIRIEQTEDIPLPDNVVNDEHGVTNTSDATNHADE